MAATQDRGVDALLTDAEEALRGAEHALQARAPDPGELYHVVDGAMRVTTTLAELVETTRQRAAECLDGEVLSELRADLQAMHGCLITGPLLLAPARDDLRPVLGHSQAEQRGMVVD
ncbi:hypothetical protein H0B56_20690 [Haloechinothrix sp. YIM 98757]|uniref:Uncharacterized protein n=1 Tax=Haloechinothrix aidingensis TaxID=2752311 RepID=A0A838AF87_9PSEU|nr:hypothetical protein [Haloechinothrix aidingensis]MBA0127969.1 hypothetical protein [Haloechinothrix aidingensis]